MKKYVVNFIVNYIKKNKKITNNEEEIIRYGIGNLYLFITKVAVLTFLAIILNIFIPYFVFTFFFALLRNVSFGVHAKKTWHCWVSSIIIFIITPFFITILNIPYILKRIISISCILLIYVLSPADTEKRPIISQNRRFIYKYLSTLLSIIYSFILIYSKNNILVNSLLFSLILQVIIISPITYRIFGVPYNNYLKFRKEEVYVS